MNGFATESRQDTCRHSILLVDDTPANVMILKGALGHDYRISTATSGPEAIAALTLSPFDLVLLDIKMQGMDGFETLERLRNLPNFDNTPVIFLTAWRDEDMEKTGLSLGAVDYISKPFVLEHVKLRIANVLHRGRLQKELALALDSAELGLWDWDIRTDRVRLDPRRSVVPEALAAGGDHTAEWRQMVHPQDLSGLRKALNSVLSGACRAIDVDLRIESNGRNWVWVHVHGKPAVWGEAGQVVQLMGTYRNIESRKSIEQALTDSEARLRLVMEATGEGIWDWNMRNGMISHNASWCRILGLDESVLEHDHSFLRSLIHPDDGTVMENALKECIGTRQRYQAEYRLRRADGEYVWVLDRGKIVEWSEEGLPWRMVGSLRDIGAQKEAEAEIHRLAFHDFLTGLPNRRLLVDRLGQALLANGRSGSHGALLFIDMDRFKELNDTLGHDAGDSLLVEVARRLQDSVRACDTVARLGGDEFVVMLGMLGPHPETARANAQTLGEKILAALNREYRHGDTAFCSTPSIGMTLFAGPPDSIETILKRADAAMYDAKSNGRNCLRFPPGQDGERA